MSANNIFYSKISKAFDKPQEANVDSPTFKVFRKVSKKHPWEWWLRLPWGWKVDWLMSWNLFKPCCPMLWRTSSSQRLLILKVQYQQRSLQGWAEQIAFETNKNYRGFEVYTFYTCAIHVYMYFLYMYKCIWIYMYTCLYMCNISCSLTVILFLFKMAKKIDLIFPPSFLRKILFCFVLEVNGRK